MEFMREYPDDSACLEWLWRTRYSLDGETAHCPKCDKQRRFRRYNTANQAQAWTCTSCTSKLYPTAGTIFHKSSTSLHLWFFAIYLITSTRCGISAKQLERELGVTYKTAWRMFTKIRNELMTQDYQGPLGGEVEADETWIGGKMGEGDRRKAATAGVRIGPYAKRREIAFATVERGGRVVALHLEGGTRYGHTLRTRVASSVKPNSVVYTG
jgi:transposase